MTRKKITRRGERREERGERREERGERGIYEPSRVYMIIKRKNKEK